MPIVNLAPFFRQQFFDASGNPLSGGLIVTDIAGTTTPQATYTDSTGTVLNTNPVVLDSSGTAAIWLIQNASYKFIIKNSSGVVLETIDNVLAPNTGSTSLGPQKQIFTNSGTFTIPAGVIAAKITVTGGGGAGGGGTAVANTSGSGGGAAATAIKWLTGLTPGNTLTVVIGTGGGGVSGAGGGNGIASTISSGTQIITTVTAGFGSGGGTGTSLGGNGGTATNGDINLGGNSGQFELVAASNGTGQLGAASMWGGAPQGSSGGAAGLVGAAPGAGGSGGGGGVGNTTGGAGAAGIAIFEWVG